MDEKRLKGLMGICVRAGQAVFGEEGCLKALRTGQAALALLDGGISDGSAEKFERLGERERIPVFRLPDGLLQEATGRPGRVMAVRPGGFAEQMTGILKEREPDS